MSEEPKQLNDFPFYCDRDEKVVLNLPCSHDDHEKKDFRFSKSPANVSLVESWSKFHHGTSMKYMKNSFTWKYIVVFLIVLFLISFMIWECFSYFHLKSELDSTVKDLHSLSMKLHYLEYNRNIATTKPSPRIFKFSGSQLESQKKKKSFAAIRLCGNGGQTETSKSGHALSLWNTTLTVGDIKTSHEYIIINRPGVYYVYAQLFFYDNKNFAKDFLHFFIRKNREKIITVASTPRSSCVPSCTRYISSIIKLQEGDDLSVAAHDTGISFKMACDKAMFGAYLLNHGI